MNQHNLCVNTIKSLAMDAVQAANSGHPGMPMGTADIATVLWTAFLKHDPADPQWPDRDRFVLSAGHGSMLLYSLLHLSGYDLPLEEIKAFRQWDSKTPGHPEYGHTPGVETTTGPLGQGFATGVGMALAERLLRETFGEDLISHYTYAIVSDGDLMEGISYEAASLAGHLGLGRMIYLYDDNEISIDGSTDLSFTEDREARFRASGWHVQTVDGHNPVAIADAIATARAETLRPSMICCKTIIGKDCPIEGTSKTHGAPLGDAYIRETKLKLGLDPEQTFAIPTEAYSAFQAHEGPAKHQAWLERLKTHPKGAELQRWLRGDLTDVMSNIAWPVFKDGESLATRKASAACLKAITAALPNLIGGSADLAGSNGTNIGMDAITKENFKGAGTIHFGIREHAMAAISNGIALHGGLIPYCATFLVFHDYMRPSVRLSCLMGQRVAYIYTHDSIFLGEDGPTHQPIETLCALRALPGMKVFRPADANETISSWKAALKYTNGPTAIILTRQGVPIIGNQDANLEEKGAQIVHDVDAPQVILVATGSEVSTCISAARQLANEQIRARVVSMPCVETYLRQDIAWRNTLLPQGTPRLTVEAATTMGWGRITQGQGDSLGIDRFGASAPYKVLAEKYGFTADNVASRAKALLE